MSFPRYPSYRDSGIDWLGEVPGHWALKPLWTLFRRVKRTGYEDEQLLSVYRDHGVVPTASRDDNFNNPSDDLSGYQLVSPGDLVINKMKAWQGSVSISEHRGIVSPAYFVFQPLHRENGRYLNYLMRSLRYITGYLSASKGIRIGQWDLEPQPHSRMPVVLPPQNEQERIAQFLNSETRKVDALVAEQQGLIQLLKEKRQAIISHAVTKGLNPRAPQKPSGVEWIGDVPAHWGVMPVKYVASIGNGATPSRENPDYWSGDFPWLTSTVVNHECVTFAEEFVSPEALQECHLPQIIPPAVLVGITGQGKTRGMATTLQIRATINQHIAFLQPIDKSLDVHFLRRVFDAAYENLRRDSEEGGSTKGAITCEQIGNLRMPIPPIEEQRQIATRVKDAITGIDDLSKQVGRAIELLEERRNALISAAVTGQVDIGQVADKVPA